MAGALDFSLQKALCNARLICALACQRALARCQTLKIKSGPNEHECSTCYCHAAFTLGMRHHERCDTCLQSMTPNLFLMTFLPILLFGSGSALDWHTFFRNAPQIFTLAFPGVGVHMVLVAVVWKYAFPYDWSWIQSFLYGAIISATDPVAVVRTQCAGK